MSFGKLFSIICVLGLAGCVGPAPSVRIPISGGQKITVNMGNGKVEGSESKDVKIGAAGFLPKPKTKEGTYFFSIGFSGGVTPRSIKIEDVSEQKPQLIVQEPKPVLEKQAWRWIGPLISADDKSMKWLHEIDDSFRVYQIFITLEGGREISLYRATFYPSYVKAHLLKELEGETP